MKREIEQIIDKHISAYVEKLDDSPIGYALEAMLQIDEILNDTMEILDLLPSNERKLNVLSAVIRLDRYLEADKRLAIYCMEKMQLDNFSDLQLFEAYALLNYSEKIKLCVQMVDDIVRGKTERTSIFENLLTELGNVFDIFDTSNQKLNVISKAEFFGGNNQKKLGYQDFVVRNNIFSCEKNHTIEQINAVVDVISNDGVVKSERITAGYCEECNSYFILETDYLKLREKGILLCKVLTYESFRSGEHLNPNIELKAESVLRQCGYTVSASVGLSKTQRQEILKRVIDSNIYTVSGLCSHLDWLIERNSRVTAKNMENAISKWWEDRSFIEKYQIDDRRNIAVKSIKITERHLQTD